MIDVDREALILDRAIDLLLAGGDVEGHPLVGEAAHLVAAVDSIPGSQGRNGARRRMFAESALRASRRRIRWFALVPAAAVLCVGGVAFAARNATPGDPLWALRRSAQDSRIVFAGGSIAKADAKLDRAEGDLALAKSLAARGRVSSTRDVMSVFWSDLSDARGAIAGLPVGDRVSRVARADSLGSSGSALESSLGDANSSGSGGLVDDRSGGSTGSPDDAKTTTTSGEDRSESDGVVSSPSATPTSGDGHSGSDGSGERSPSPSPSSSSGDGGSGSDSGSGGSGSDDH